MSADTPSNANPSPPFFASDRVRAATVLGACLVLTSVIWAVGQYATAARYQIAGTQAHAFVLDTATGEVSEKFAGTSSGPGSWTREKTH